MHRVSASLLTALSAVSFNKALHLSCDLICLAPLKSLREAARSAFRLGLAIERFFPFATRG